MDPTKIEIIRVDRDAEYEVMFEIRRIVFQEEQAVPEEIEVADDHVAHHYLALYEGVPVGTARWRITLFGKVKLERFAVLQDYRGKGLGTALVQAVLRDVPRTLPVYLNAQMEAVPFYEQLGFQREGETFWEAEIEHQRMKWVYEASA